MCQRFVYVPPLFPLQILLEIVNHARYCYIVEIIDLIGLFEAFYSGIGVEMGFVCFEFLAFGI